MGDDLEDLAVDLYILEKSHEKNVQRKRETQEKLEKARRQPDVKISEGDFINTIEELKEDNADLQCNSEQLLKELSKEDKLEIQNKILQTELDAIKKKIKQSKPKWILDDFSPFLYNAVDKMSESKCVFVKIADGHIAKELTNIGKKLEGEKNFEFKVIWTHDNRFMYINKKLDERKIFDLIRAYIFYSNTQYEYKELKFAKDWLSISAYKAMLVVIGLPVLGIILFFIIMFNIR